MNKTLVLAASLLVLAFPAQAQDCFNYTNPIQPPLLDEEFVGWPLAGLGADGDLLVTLTFGVHDEEWVSLHTHDAQDPENIVDLADVWNFVGGGVVGPPDLCFVGDHLYFNTQSSLCGFDLTDPAAPAIDFVMGGYVARGLRVGEDVAWIVTDWAGLDSRDLSGSGQPALLGNVGLTGDSGSAVELVGDHVYVASYTIDAGWIDVFDGSDPAAPTLVATLVLPSPVRGHLFLDGDRVYYHDRNDEIRILDVTAPAAPVLTPIVVPARPGGGAGGMTARGDRLYVADDVGVRVFDTSLPADPMFLGSFDSSGDVVDCALGDGFLATISIDNGYLRTAPLDCGSVVAVDPAPAARARVSAHPNPFNPRTDIVVELSARQHVRVTIHDTRGRELRELFEGELPAGSSTFNWRGVDDAGHSLGSGVYHLRVRGARDRGNTNLVLIR